MKCSIYFQAALRKSFDYQHTRIKRGQNICRTIADGHGWNCKRKFNWRFLGFHTTNE